MTFSSYNEPFLDLTNSKVRASPSGVGSDPPSFWNHQLNIQKHDLLNHEAYNVRTIYKLIILTFPSYNEPNLDLTNSKVRASPSGVGSDPPSFWNHQSNIQKHVLLKKTENLHAALETKVYTSDPQNDIFEKVYTLISNTRYMTLGPKFYTKLVSAITRRRMHLNQWFRGESKKVRHSPSSDSVETRFKAIFKKWPFWIRRCCFSWFFTPGGRLNHEAYNVEQFTNRKNVKNRS